MPYKEQATMHPRSNSGVYTGSKTLWIALMLSMLSICLLSVPCSMAGHSDYLSILGPCELQFPKDHGPHPGYGTEWWYYTGNVHSGDGASFGFQLTFFRHQFVPPGKRDQWPKDASAWRTDQIYFAHAALSDISGGSYYHDDRISRGALGLAEAKSEPQGATVFVKDWSLQLGPAEHLLKATTESFALQLSLIPQKPPVLHGKSGYSLKGSSPESSSCYYSFSRLKTKGILIFKGKEIPVEGNSWMDHEFSSAPLESDLVGWDWFSLQLTDDTEVMVYLLRRRDGTLSPASSGTLIDAAGLTTGLTKEDIALEVLKEWRSPHSKAKYPIGWRLRIGSIQLDLTITANLKDQEMTTQETTQITYWEGSVSVRGTKKDGEAIAGEGYVELTGYDKPLNLPE